MCRKTQMQLICRDARSRPDSDRAGWVAYSVMCVWWMAMGDGGMQAPSASSNTHSLSDTAPGTLEPSAALPIPSNKAHCLKVHLRCRIAGLHRALPRIHACGLRIHRPATAGRPPNAAMLGVSFSFWCLGAFCNLHVSVVCSAFVRFGFWVCPFFLFFSFSFLVTRQAKPAEASCPPSPASLPGCSLLVIRCSLQPCHFLPHPTSWHLVTGQPKPGRPGRQEAFLGKTKRKIPGETLATLRTHLR